MKTLLNVSLKEATVLTTRQLKLITGGATEIIKHIEIGYDHFGSMNNCQQKGWCAGDKDQSFWAVPCCKDKITANSAQNILQSNYASQGANFRCF